MRINNIASKISIEFFKSPNALKRWIICSEIRIVVRHCKSTLLVSKSVQRIVKSVSLVKGNADYTI